MKTLITKIFLLSICLINTVITFAENVTVDGIVYDVIKKGKVATLVNGRTCSGDVKIPEYITFEGVDCAVTKIGEMAFGNLVYNNFSLTSIILPESITTIDNFAFANCKNLHSCNLPSNLTTIGQEIFDGASSLSSITFPENINYIPYMICAGCSSMTDITIKSEVLDRIQSQAFANCKNLENVYCYATIPPTTYKEDAFNGSYIEYATLYVPANSIDAYKSTAPWKDFGAICALAEDEGQCAMPIISYENGKLEFSSSTQGAQYHYTISDEDVVTDIASSGSVNLNATLNISVYAEAAGYTRSETATATLCWIDGTLNTDGIETTRAEKRPILVSNNGGELHITGVTPGENVAVYSVSGRQVGATVAMSNEVTLNTHTLDGNIAIIKVGQESVIITLK